MLVEVDAPAVVRPRVVEGIQGRLKEKIGQPVLLYVRTSVTHDVSSKGAIKQAAAEALDGIFISREFDERIEILQASEQLI